MSLNEKVDEATRFGKKVFSGITVIVKKAVAKGKEIHADVQEKGGYRQAMKDSAHSIEDRLFTDGKYDPEKAKELARDGAQTAKVYGKKALDYVVEMGKKGAEKGAEAVKTGYRDLVPTKEERETVYAGIGAKYAGFLFRPDYEKCLKFHELAKTKLPAALKIRKVLLDDIKASASKDPQDLMGFYRDETGFGPEADTKVEAIKRYLPWP